MSSDYCRNIGIISHIDAGKTTTTERILYYTGKIHKVGEVNNGTALMDWMEQEQERGITITSAATCCEWSFGGNKYKLNIIDTPGHVDFTAEVERSLRVLDGGVILLCAVGGVQPQTETVWAQARKHKVPCIAFVNKMDRVGADFYAVVSSMPDRLGGCVPIIMQMPIGSEEGFIGCIDLVEITFIVFDISDRMDFREEPVPEEYHNTVISKRQEMLETLSFYDDLLLEYLLENKDISSDFVYDVIRRMTVKSVVVPVFCGSSFKNKGIQQLLDAVVRYLPSPSDLEFVEDDRGDVILKRSFEERLSVLVFKVSIDPFFGQLNFVRVYSGKLVSGSNVFNVRKDKDYRIGKLFIMNANRREAVSCLRAGDIGAIAGSELITGDTLCERKYPLLLESLEFSDPVINMAIEAVYTSDQDKLDISLSRLSQEDPSFDYRIDNETGQTIVSGMGELHLEIILDRLKREFKVPCKVGTPRVSYRETIKSSAEAEYTFDGIIDGKHRKARCWLRVSPSERGDGFMFSSSLLSECLPDDFVHTVRESARMELCNGVLSGYPVTDIYVELVDAEMMDGFSDKAVSVATIFALRKALSISNIALMEPSMEIEITVPSEFRGCIIGDFNSRCGRIRGIYEESGVHVLSGEAPLSKMFGYATNLRSRTQGRASYSMRFHRYIQVSESDFKDITSCVY